MLFLRPTRCKLVRSHAAGRLGALFPTMLWTVCAWMLSGSPKVVQGTDDWLITPEEAAMAAPEAPMIQSRGFADSGPAIEIVKPVDGSAAPSPVEIVVRFGPRAEAVDVSSLKVVLLKIIAIDITDRVRPYAMPSGIDVKEAKIPPGIHRVRISVADTKGGTSTRDLSFTVQ